MGKICILDENTCNKIAAGEVIERPASIVKELVENAIDAGASFIDIDIKRGGIGYIRITDDGCGFERDDMVIAFERHATSKIRHANELSDINTMGFRGEALASIAAVADVELYSKHLSVVDSEEGYFVKVRGGEIVAEGERPCRKGTTIIVRDLFFNMPVRYKFLKKDSAEASAINDIVMRISLANPNISFRLSGAFTSKNEIFHTPGNNDLLSTIYTVYGREYANSIYPLQYEDEIFKITGYIGNASVSKSNRSYQSIYINDRYIKCPVITSSIENACKNIFMVKRFPFYVIKIYTSNQNFDVNVHPAKTEVRFVDEHKLASAVYYAVQSAFANNDHVLNVSETSSMFSKNFVTNDDETKSIANANVNNENQNMQPNASLGTNKAVNTNRDFAADTTSATSIPASASPSTLPSSASASTTNEDAESTLLTNLNLVTSEPDKTSGIDYNKHEEYVQDSLVHLSSSQNQSDEQNSEHRLMNESRQVPTKPQTETQTGTQTEKISFLLKADYIGQVFSTYLLFEFEKKMYVIDQHAAHERINYEQIRNEHEKGNVSSQLLLTPVIVNLAPMDFSVAIEKNDVFDHLGFVIGGFGGNSIAVRGIPSVLDIENTSDTITLIIEQIKTNKTNMSRLLDNALYQIACKMSVKANDKLTHEEVTSLVRQLCNTQSPLTCPHGRPTVLEIFPDDFAKLFKRIQ